MLSPERPDRIRVAFDDHRLVATAGLLLPVTLAGRLGLSEYVESHLDLGDAPVWQYGWICTALTGACSLARVEGVIRLVNPAKLFRSLDGTI